MSVNENDGRLDALLDQMLEAYSAVEPRPGFETRIRARVQSHVAAKLRRAWILSLASSMAVVMLVVWAAQTHIAKREVPGPISVRRPAVAPAPRGLSAPGTRKTEVVSATARVPRRIRNSNQVLLKLANFAHSSETPVFQNERTYTAPKPEMDSSVEVRAQPAMPETKVNLEDLSVPSIEIKELAPANDVEKGNI